MTDSCLRTATPLTFITFITQPSRVVLHTGADGDNETDHNKN
eukprot:COSAG01_NODE_7332_length_3247_cov_2.094663_4_plen_42_part_00